MQTLPSSWENKDEVKKDAIRHELNGAHICCKLICFGIDKRIAQDVAQKIEALLHPLLYSQVDNSGDESIYSD